MLDTILITLLIVAICIVIIGDVLVVNVMRAIGFKVEDYAKRHHGGYIGHLSRSKSN